MSANRPTVLWNIHALEYSAALPMEEGGGSAQPHAQCTAQEDTLIKVWQNCTQRY